MTVLKDSDKDTTGVRKFSPADAHALTKEFFEEQIVSPDFVRWYLGGPSMSLRLGNVRLTEVNYHYATNIPDTQPMLRQPTVFQALERVETSLSESYPMAVECDPPDVQLSREVLFYDLGKPNPIIFIGNDQAQHAFLASWASGIKQAFGKRTRERMEVLGMVPAKEKDTLLRYLRLRDERDAVFTFSDTPEDHASVMTYIENIQGRETGTGPQQSIILYYEDGSHRNDLERIYQLAAQRRQGTHFVIIGPAETVVGAPRGAAVFAGAGSEAWLNAQTHSGITEVLPTQMVLVSNPGRPRYWMFAT